MKPVRLFMFICLAMLGCSDNDTHSPSLKDIAGVWDATHEEDGLEDVSYIVISTSGDYTVYNYLGDAYDDLEECYDKVEWTITDLGGGYFAIEGDDIGTVEGKAKLSNGQLIISDDSDTYVWQESDLDESDFIPLCLSEINLSDPL